MTIQLPVSAEDLYKSLKELSVLDEKTLEKVKKESLDSGISFEETLVERDMISDVNMGKTIADMSNLPFVRLSEEAVSDLSYNLLPKQMAEQYGLFVFRIDDKLHIASYKHVDSSVGKNLLQKSGKNTIIEYYATKRDIQNALSGYQKDIKDILQRKINEFEKPSVKKEQEVSVVSIVDTLFYYAYSSNASDIHIEPEEKKSVVRVRIDGVMHEVVNLSRNTHNHIISRIKVLSKLKTDEHASAQDGKMQFTADSERVDVRVSIVPIVHGEKCVMRLLASHFQQLTLQDLGMSESDLKKVQSGYHKPHGMILSTGPTGSGKSTTMYAILKILNTKDRNIATIEDPVEYDIQGINQIQVNEKTNLTFAEGLRSILRQDPNVIYIGEIRDKETAGIAINSAMTGHLVLSTLHTNDAATSIPRLIDFGIEPFLVASTVEVIIAQRLVRKICPSCRVSQEIKTTDLYEEFGKETVTDIFGKEVLTRLFKGKGCDVCHLTGYKGRVGIFEVLTLSEQLKKLIMEKADSDKIMKQAIIEGMNPMIRDALYKIQNGLTTIEEVIRVIKT